MRQKKLLRLLSAMLVIIFVIASLLTGCGKASNDTSEDMTATDSNTSNNSESKSNETAKDDKPTLEPYTVNYVVIKAIADMSDQPVVEEHLNDYLAEHAADILPNTKIKFTLVEGSEAGNQVSLMAAAGEPFDLFMNPWGLPLAQAVAKGIAIPLDDLLNKHGQTIMKRIEPKYWQAATFKGKKYAIPHPFVYAQTAGIVLKKDLVEKYNFDYKSVKDIKDLEPFLAAVKKGEPGMVPLFPLKWNFLWNLSKHDMDGWYDVETGKVIWPYDNEGVIERAKTLSEYYKKGYIAKDWISKIDARDAECKTGKYAVMPDAGIYDETGEKSTNAYGFPTVEVPMYTPLIGTDRVLSCFTCISATSKDPERAMMLQDYMYADKTFFNMSCYGKEGLNYEVVEGAGTDNPTVRTLENSKWTIWACWTGPLWDQWPSNWNSAAALERMKKQTDSAAVSPILGFVQDNEPIKKEMAQIQPIMLEMDKILTSGSAPDVEKYLAEQKERARKAGLDKVIEELTRQIEEWKAANGK
ncbi:MAG TPA: extracellular solute-binding protein [Clostridiaceae bacterium]|nr:extracellular solute-binding protein [Clostridiaceae bacterium]